MAETLRSDEGRSRRNENWGLVRGTSSAKSKPTNEERTDREDKVIGFNQIKSIRSHLGSRTKDAPTTSEANRPVQSTSNIPHDMRKGDNPRPITTTVPATPFCPSTKQTRHSMGKQLSASANDLFSSSSSAFSSSSSSSSSANRWIPPSSQRIASSATTTSSGNISNSKNITPNTSRHSYEVSSGSSTDLIDAFFVDRWSHGHSDIRTRAFSSGDAEEVADAGLTLTFDLDSIGRTKSLDVSAAKDRISVKQKGKKLTFALEERVRRAKAGLRPAVDRVQLHSVAELDEGEEDEKAGEVSSKNGRSRTTRGQVDHPGYSSVYRQSSAQQEAVAQNPGAGAVPARRKRSQAGPPVPEKKSSVLQQRNSIGFSVTPAMLAGALRKQPTPGGGGQSSLRRIKPIDADASRSPPPDGEERRPRRRRQEEQAIGTDEDPKQNGAFPALLRPQVVPRFSDEDRDKGARPKVPPKTRPKTMLHPSPVSPAEPLPSPPEWLTRLKKRSAVVE